MHLYKYTAEAPNIDGLRVGHSQKHLWRSVETTLNVAVYFSVGFAGATKIYKFDGAALRLAEEDVLRF